MFLLSDLVNHFIDNIIKDAEKNIFLKEKYILSDSDSLNKDFDKIDFKYLLKEKICINIQENDKELCVYISRFTSYNDFYSSLFQIDSLFDVELYYVRLGRKCKIYKEDTVPYRFFSAAPEFCIQNFNKHRDYKTNYASYIHLCEPLSVDYGRFNFEKLKKSYLYDFLKIKKPYACLSNYCVLSKYYSGEEDASLGGYFEFDTHGSMFDIYVYFLDKELVFEPNFICTINKAKISRLHIIKE